MQEESQLLQQAQSGDRVALLALLDRHQASILRFCSKMCRSTEDAQDVAQETLLAMARGVADFRGDASLSTWLYTIARSHVIKKQRKASNNHEVHDPLRAEGVAANGDPERALADLELDRAVESAIRALEPDAREVLVLRDIEGLTAAEVATITGQSVASVKSRLHRARIALRAALVPQIGENAANVQCPDIVRVFSQHLEDEIAPEHCAQMEAHVATCNACKMRCDSLKRTLRLCKVAHGTVPSSVQANVRNALRSVLGI
jgi:RNA polymerase sigma-70 factor, ECF subfamily